MDSISKRLLAGALGFLALTTSCGGGAAATPTATPSESAPQATQTATFSQPTTPTVAAGNADYFTVTVKSGPFAGTYTGTYQDQVPLCQQALSVPGSFQASFNGTDESGQHPIQLTLNADPSQPDLVQFRFSVWSEPGSTGTVAGYTIDTTHTPAEGSASVSFGTEGTATTAKVTGKTDLLPDIGTPTDGPLAPGPAVNVTLVCHVAPHQAVR